MTNKRNETFAWRLSNKHAIFPGRFASKRRREEKKEAGRLLANCLSVTESA